MEGYEATPDNLDNYPGEHEIAGKWQLNGSSIPNPTL
jgi:hypothetical protein